MSVNPTRPNVDPLDAARQQMNFEAIAEQAPTSKEILFKAQTIVPIATPRPWEKIGKGAGALAVTAILLLAPVYPQPASVALVNVQFEQKFTQADAQSLAYDVQRDLTRDVLLGAGFNRAPGQSVDDNTGKLQLSMVQFNTSKNKLTAAAQSAVRNKPKASEPFFNAFVVAQHTTWRSIPQAVSSAINPGGSSPHPPLDQFTITKDILNNENLIGLGLSEYFATRGQYELESFNWLDSSDSELSESHDFALPAWPQWVGIGVKDYSLMTGEQQAGIRWIAEEYLDMLNLSNPELAFHREAGSGNPVTIAVVTPQNSTDSYLSSLVKAYVAPELAKLENLTEPAVNRIVTAACEKVLPRNEFSVIIKPAGEPGPGYGPQYFKAVIKVSDKLKTKRWRLERDPLLEAEQSAEF